MNNIDELLKDGKWQILYKAFKGLEAWKVPEGDYLEFGVFEGMSFKHACHLSKRFNHKNMHFYAFDSFQGLPKPTLEEENKYEHFSEGQFSCSQETFCDILKKSNIDLNEVTCIPGFYEDSLTSELKKKLPIKRASIVWIDVDLYESTLPVLNWVTEYLTNGTFLIFDDWFSFGANPFAGELKATNEWLSANPQINLVEYDNFHTAGKAFLVQRYDQA
jgi:O-methyltransferase